MSDIQKVLASGEQILWQGKPQFWNFALVAMPLCLLASVMVLIALIQVMTANVVDYFQILPIFLISGVIGPGGLLFQYLRYRVSIYAITDKRTLIQSGVIGRDFVSIEHAAVVSASVNVSVLDKIFGKNSGTLKIIYSGSSQSLGVNQHSKELVGIASPYDVYQIFNKISHDVRSDIQYPNAMRPASNPGYKTEYKQ